MRSGDLGKPINGAPVIERLGASQVEGIVASDLTNVDYRLRLRKSKAAFEEDLNGWDVLCMETRFRNGNVTERVPRFMPVYGWKAAEDVPTAMLKGECPTFDKALTVIDDALKEHVESHLRDDLAWEDMRAHFWRRILKEEDLNSAFGWGSKPEDHQDDPYFIIRKRSQDSTSASSLGGNQDNVCWRPLDEVVGGYQSRRQKGLEAIELAPSNEGGSDELFGALTSPPLFPDFIAVYDSQLSGWGMCLGVSDVHDGDDLVTLRYTTRCRMEVDDPKLRLQKDWNNIKARFDLLFRGVNSDRSSDISNLPPEELVRLRWRLGNRKWEPCAEKPNPNELEITEHALNWSEVVQTFHSSVTRYEPH